MMTPSRPESPRSQHGATSSATFPSGWALRGLGAGLLWTGLSALATELPPSSLGPAVPASPPGIRVLDDLEELEIQLEIAPDDPALLLEAAQAAFADANDDLAIWYAELARLAAEGTGDARGTEKEITKLRGEIGVELPPVGRAIDEYSKEVFNYAKICKSAKLYANLADMLGGLGGTPYERDAKTTLEKLFKKDAAVEAMLESGVPVKVTVRKKRSDAETKRLNERHSEWEEAYELKGSNYTIVTNMGVEWAEAVLQSMEQMNVFYRQVFNHKARGGGMKRCKVYIFKTRDEFDAANPDIGATVAGFFRPGENSVSAYDPRTAEGFMQQTIEDFWSTLYHEASHQFTRAVWNKAIPTWLNEGTASYFEGAALLPGGFVETNRIPEGRLRSLVSLLGINDLNAKPKEGESAAKGKNRYEPSSRSPGLKTVVSYMAPGSYPGEYYPFGWGLVYFCMNYENEAAERIYEPIYKGFMESYMKGGEEKPFQRFVTYFVDDAGVEEIKTFEDFENRWINWIAELARREFGGPEQADKLIADGLNEIENGKPEYALQSLRWALRKRADDPLALKLLAESYEATDNGDAALFNYRKLAEVARGADKMDEGLPGYDGTAAEALTRAYEGLKSVNNSLGSKMEEGIPKFVESTLAEANAWVEAGYPRVGMHALKMGIDLVGGDGTLKARSEAIAEEHDVSVKRTRRIPTADFEGWTYYGGNWQSLADGTTTTLENPDDKVSEATFQKMPPKTFLYEVDLDLGSGKDQPLAGLTFAGGASGNRTFIRVGSRGRFGLLDFDPDTRQPKFLDEGFKKGADSKDGKLTMGIEVGLEATRFLVNGEEVGKIEQAASAFEGQLGVATWGAAKFSNPRLTY